MSGFPSRGLRFFQSPNPKRRRVAASKQLLPELRPADPPRLTIHNTFRTCPVHFFGHAGTNLGRGAGHLLPPEVTLLVRSQARRGRKTASRRASCCSCTPTRAGTSSSSTPTYAAPGVSVEAAVPFLSHRMYLLISFRKSTPPQNRQLNILISHSKK